MARSEFSKTQWLKRPSVIGTLLGFTAGYVDTVCFVALFGLFTAHVTGNFVLIGAEIAHPMQGGVLMKLLAFPAFMVAVAVARLVALHAGEPAASSARPLLMLQATLLAACMLCGWRAEPIVSADAPWVIATGMLGAAAMGVQNAANRLAFGSLAPTTVMTGNVTQLVMDAVDLLRNADDDGVRDRIQKYLWPVIAFGTGAICGAFAQVYASLWALALPLLVVLSLGIAHASRSG